VKEWSAMEILFVSVEGTRLLLALNYAQVHFFVYIWLNLRKMRMAFFLVPREYRILFQLVELVQICGARFN